MDRKRFWLNPNESVGYSQIKINQVHMKDNGQVNLKTDKKRKNSHDNDEFYHVISKTCKFEELYSA